MVLGWEVTAGCHSKTCDGDGAAVVDGVDGIVVVFIAVVVVEAEDET